MFTPLASQLFLWICLGWAGFRLWRATSPSKLDRFLESERNTWAPEDKS